MNRSWIKQTFLDEQKKKKREKSPFQGHVPIVKQLEDMLKTHTVQPGETLWGIAQQHLQSGERWPDIRDLNIPVLKEGLSRFAPGDPRLQRELGHWIFPGQVFQIPKEPSALPPPGFQQELQRLLQEKRIQDRIQPSPRPDIGVKEPIPQPPPVKEPSIVEPEFPDLHPRQRGLSLKQPTEWATIDPEKQKQFDEKVSKVSKGTLSVLDTIGLSLSSGGAHLTESLLNIPRAVYGLSMHLWDLITPDSFYKIENDPILGAYNKRMDDLSKYIAKTIDKPLQEKDMSVAEEFLSIGFAAVPQVVAAAMLAYGMGPLAAIDKATIPASASTILGTFAKTYPNVARMLPFGVIAASGAQMEAEQEGATFLQAVGSGVLSGMGEMATESLPFDQFMKIVNKMGIKPLVEQGSKNLFKHYGAVGLDYLKGVVMEVAQEAVMEPWSQLAKKITYDKTMPLTGEGGVFDMDAMIQGGYGGLAMTVVLGALGLPATARSHHMTRRAMQEQQRVNLFELAAEMNRELNNYNQILGWKPDQPVGIEHSGVEHLDNFSFDVFDISGERGYVHLKNNRGDIVSIQLGDIKHIDGNKIILHQDVIPVIQQGLGSVFDLNSEDGVRNALEQILSGFTDYDDAFTALEWIDRNNSVFYTAFGTEVNPVLFRQALDLSRQYPELSPLEEPPKKAPVETRKRPPEVVPTEKPQAGKLPKEAYDLVVRTKNSLKKKYGRDLITWIEGGEKPPIPDGLGESEAKDMETKLIKIAERVGMAPTEEASPKEPWQMTKDELVKNMEVYGEGVGAWEQDKPWTGELPPVGTWRMDPNTGALEQLRLMDVNEITPMEPEDEVRGRDDYKQYVEWAKQGIQPPPITVVRGIEDGNWLSINRRRLMAAKESGQKTILAWVSDTDMETAMPTPTHKSVVEQALKEGKPVPPEVLADYPELTPEPGEAKTEKPPAEETVRVYKGWVPYDFRDPAKPMIERVERQSEFPSFTKKDAGIKVAGFFTTDISVAKHFAKGIGKDGVVGTFDLTIGRALEIDAKGEKAGNVQFEDQGKQFRDAARSGEYDTIIIRNTSDEGDVYVALSPDNIGIVSHDSILDAEGNLIADEPPAKTEKPPAEKKEAPPTKALSDYGLQIVKTKTAKGNPVWEVSGNTHQHKDAIRRAGGKWYGAKKVWSFYEDNDPTSKLLDTLAGKEVKDSDVDTGRAEAAETKGSGKITGLDRRVSVQQAEREHYKQYLITRGGVPKDVKGGPGNDPAISKILRPHQVDGVNMAVAAIDQYGGFILADGTGAGKTMQIVATMNHYMKQGNVALVVVPNRTIINDAYKRDAGMLGIDYNVVKGGALEKGKLNITTYASLSKVKKVPDYVAFDEAHSLKNVDAARSKLGRRMAGNAKGVLFASATPFDKGEHLPYLEKTGIFSKRSHEQIMVGLGYKKDTLTVSTSYGERQITIWKPDAPLAERVRRMDALFDEVAGLGLMVKREVSMDRVAVGYWNIELPAEAHAKLNEVEDHYLEKYEAGDASQLPPLAKAQMLMAQRRFQEHYKKKDVCALAKSEIEAGRQVVIFATRTSPSHLKEPIYAMFGGERVLVDEFIVDTSPPTLPDIAEMFEKEGIKCSKIYGGGNVDKEVAKFQKGETKVALATPEKGGAGLSLDDTVGDSPRTMIVMTPLFSGVDNVQLPGRINRMSTKSSSRVVYVLADTAIDEWNKAIITEKMKTLNAVVRGDISKLDLDDMDRDAGAEALPEPEKETFKQERLKDRQMEVVSRRGHSRPYGPQWEVQVTTFRDVETGKEYLWWSDRALSDFVPELKAGDKVTLTATTRQGYGGNDINLTHVKVDRTGPVPNKPADHHIRPMSKREGARIENHYDVGMTRVLFDNAPGEEVERQFKGRGFEWNASAKAWEKKIGKSSAKHAEEVLDKYFKPEKPAATRGEPLGDIAGYTETVIMDTKTSEDITIRREYRIVELTAKGEKPYSVQQRVIKGGDAGEWRAVAAFDESMDANEYVAGIDDIVAIDPDVADQIKTEEPKEKAEPLKPFEPIEKGNKDSAFTEVDNIEVHFEYCLSEADDIVTSFAGIDSVKPNPSYYQDDQRLQPRNINRKATQNRINEFVAKLEPRRMGENTEISKGAPTVGADGRVEIGNHRTWALITAYKKDLPLATKYRKWLTDNATKFGISKGAVERAKEPILVRLRTTDIDRAELARKGNVPGEQKMSAAETAELDAQKIDDRLMAAFVPHEEGRLETADNKNFINRFIHDVVPSSERNDMIAADGSGLTVDGEKRIRNAILAKVYGNTNALIKLMEETNPNVRNIMNAMNVLAPKLLLQKHEMEKGNLYPLDLSENLSRAMVKMSELRDSKMTVEGYFSARQLFGIELTNLEKDILAILDENKFSALRIGSIFKEYIRGVEVLGHPKQISIISQTPPTRAELLQASVEKAKEGWELTKSEKQEKAGQSSLFKDKEMDGERNIKTNAEGGGGVSKGGTQKAVGPAPKLKTAPPLQSIPPTRRRDIVKFLSDKLDIPIRVGRYRQQARGIFKTWQEVIRTKLAQDIPTIAHEVGHYLDKKFNLSATKSFDGELMSLGQVTSKPSYSKSQVRAEGVAEFMRLYLTDPQDAIRQAPHYYAAFEQIMAANQDIHDVLLQARQDITNWISQPAKARVLGVLSVGEKSGRKMTLDRLYAAAVDELHPIKKYVDALFPEGVDFDEDPFMQAWLSRGWAGKAETLLNHGIVDKDYKKIGPSLKEILDPVKANLDDFRAYITAKRAIELHGRDIESGITLEDAEQVVKELETPEFIKAQKKLVGFSDALVDVLVDAQILDKAGADTFRAMNRNYVPFYRVFEEMGGSHGYGKTGYANLGNPVRRMKGSQRDIVDPLESIVRNAFFFTNVAERNNVGRLVVELAEFKEGAGKWVEKVPAPIRPVTFGLSEIKDALEGIGIDTDGLDLDNAATIFRPSPFPAGKENILAVWREGKREFYQVEPELYRALLSLDKESANLFVNLLSKPAALLRAGATLSPDFMVRNPIRDMWTALVYSKYGYKPADFIRGLFSVLKKDDLYWKFHASGAAHGAMVSLDRDYLQGSLRGMLQTSAKEKAKFLLTHPVEVLRALSEYGEMATRLGEFGRGVKAEGKKGKGIRQAALSARDVTLDFARWGNVGKIPNRVIAFFNANIQGMDKMARAFRQKPGQSILRCLLYITLPSIILYMMNRDDERYQELPQWEKDLFWIVLTPKHVFRIPKPFELGVIFGTLPERVLDYIYTEDPEAFKGYLNTVKEAGLPDILPTAFTGWLEAFYANKSFFTDRPIVPVGEERLPAEMQYGNYTSETAKLIGRYLHISPRKADHIAYSYGGGLARYGTKVLDQLLEAVGATEQVTKPASTLADYPVVGAFTSRVWSNSKSMDTLYTRLDEAEKAYSKRKAGRELTAKEQERLSNLGRYRSAASDMSELRLAGQRVFDDPRMTAEEKREKMDTINILRINIARRAIGLDPITVKP